MPGRRVFFQLEDIWRASIVRKAGQFDVTARAGWTDASLWEDAKRKGESEIRRLIDTNLNGTSVTAVLIGADTAKRRWVDYEIEKSIERLSWAGDTGLLKQGGHRLAMNAKLMGQFVHRHPAP